MKRLMVLGGGMLVATLILGCATPAVKTAETGVDPNYDASKQKAIKLTQTARETGITVDARVLFDTGKAEVKGDGQVAIDRIASLLKDKTTANVIIEGHTDSTGSPQLNQRLSEQRADSVRAGLVSRGVPLARLQTKGLGLSQPVAENATEDGRAQNRRVEIVMLGETLERIGGKAEEERLASGLEKFLQNAEQLVRGVFDKWTGNEKKSQ